MSTFAIQAQETTWFAHLFGFPENPGDREQRWHLALRNGPDMHHLLQDLRV